MPKKNVATSEPKKKTVKRKITQRARQPIDKNHIFLLKCMEQAEFKPNYQSIADDLGIAKDAVRMRYKRLVDRIHAATVADDTSRSGRSIKQEEPAEGEEGTSSSNKAGQNQAVGNEMA